MGKNLGRIALWNSLRLAAILAALSLGASATTIMSLALIDQGTPSGTIPYLSAAITNSAPNEVLMVLSAPGLKHTNSLKEFVSLWTFNIDPALEATLGTAIFTVQSPMTTLASAPTITKGQNNQSASPSTNYDLKFTFATSNSGGGASRFEQPDIFAVKIGLLGINENSFTYQNVNGIGHRIAYSYAHIQAGESGSSKIYSNLIERTVFPQGVPEPSTYSMLAGALGVLAFLRRKHSA